MKKMILKKIKKNLLEQKVFLFTKINKVDNSEIIDIDGDEVDEIQGALIASVSQQLSSRDNQKLCQIQNALAKIEDGTFGKCEDCDEEIAEKRLEFNPYFTTCISCAEQRELDSKKR